MIASLAAFLVALSLVRAEDDAHVELRGPEPAVVRLGESATVTLSIDGAHDAVALAPLPAVDGVEWSASAPVETTVQRIGARSVASAPRSTWTITITPRRAGAFALPPLVAEIGGAARSVELPRIEAVADLADDPHAFVEVVAPRGRCFLGERLPVTLRVGFDRTFFAENAIATFLRPIDLPLAIESPDFNERRGGRAATGRAVVLNGRAVDATPAADVTIDGRAFGVIEIVRTLVPDRSGDVVVPAPLLRFAYASRFDRDPFGARVPADRNDAITRGKSIVLHVDELPEAGRPRGFTGAVGKFAARARADKSAVDVGESIKLTVEITGDGDLAHFAPPAFTDLAEFAYRGRAEHADATVNSVTFDVAAKSAGVTALPAIEFAFFDPTPPGAYRTVKTEPIPLAVRGAATAANAQVPHDPKDRNAPTDSTKPIRATFVLILALACAAVALLAGAASRRRTAARARTRALADLATTFAAHIARAEGKLSEGFTDYLAARLGCSPSAVIAPDLARRLADAGVPRDVARRAAAIADALVAARYGAPAAPVDESELRGIVEELEAAFRGV